MIQEITTEEFKNLPNKGKVLIDFFSKTCGPCKMLGYVLNDIAKEMPDFSIYKIDFDENQKLKEELGVKGFPTMLFLVDGQEKLRMEGLQQKPKIIQAINSL